MRSSCRMQKKEIGIPIIHNKNLPFSLPPLHLCPYASTFRGKRNADHPTFFTETYPLSPLHFFFYPFVFSFHEKHNMERIFSIFLKLGFELFSSSFPLPPLAERGRNIFQLSQLQFTFLAFVFFFLHRLSCMGAL